MKVFIQTGFNWRIRMNWLTAMIEDWIQLHLRPRMPEREEIRWRYRRIRLQA
jgi:hypothetical protein